MNVFFTGFGRTGFLVGSKSGICICSRGGGSTADPGVFAFGRTLVVPRANSTYSLVGG